MIAVQRSINGSQKRNRFIHNSHGVPRGVFICPVELIKPQYSRALSVFGEFGYISGASHYRNITRNNSAARKKVYRSVRCAVHFKNT